MTGSPGTRRWHHQKGLAAVVVIPAMLAAGAVSAGAQPPEAWDVEHAEISASRIAVGAADSGTMPDGSFRMYAVTNATPNAHLVEIDPWEGVVVESHELTGSTGSWGVHVAADGTVWAGSYSQGIVYQLPWESDAPIAHPRATPDTSFVWQVDTDDAGNLYGGTFEGWAENDVPGRLIRIAPDGEQHLYEPFRETDQYVRSTAVVGDRVYAGTGAGYAQLYEVDPATGDREVIPLPEELGTCAFVYSLTAAGEDLGAQFHQCENAEHPTGYVFDRDSRSWYTGAIPIFSGEIAQSTDDGTLYLGAEGLIQSYDPVTGELEALSDTPTSGTKDVELAVDPESGNSTVFSLAADGNLIRHDIDSGTHTNLTVEGLSGDSGRTARAAVVGPDEAYYVSLRTTGGLGRFDPSDGTWTFEPGIGQAQGMTVHEDIMYIGTYSQAHIFAYDPNEDWDEENPQELFRLDGHGQDRPFAMVSAGEHLAIGTVPYYGNRTGALTLYDPGTEELTVHTEPFTDRSITALTYREGVLYGGTAIYGGGGTTPVRTEGTAFAWDIATETMLWETVPLPGETGIGAVTVDEHGRLFAASVGQVVEIDPATGTPLQSVTVTDDTSDQLDGAWHISDLSYNEAEGALYLSTGEEIVRLSPSTLADLTPVATSGELLRIADDGTNFWMSGRAVHTGTLDPLAAATVVEPLPVTFVDEPGTTSDVIVVPDVDGVRYLLDGEELTAGEHGAAGEVTVTAAPADGFRIGSDPSRWWSHTFDDEAEEPTPGPADPEPDATPSDPGPGAHPGEGVEAETETDRSTTEMPATGVSLAGIAVFAILALIAGLIAQVPRMRAMGS